MCVHALISDRAGLVAAKVQKRGGLRVFFSGRGQGTGSTEGIFNCSGKWVTVGQGFWRRHMAAAPASWLRRLAWWAGGRAGGRLR